MQTILYTALCKMSRVLQQQALKTAIQAEGILPPYEQ